MVTFHTTLNSTVRNTLGFNMTQEYEFTTDWFTKNLVVWDKIFAEFHPSKILEIGAFEGRATCWLIDTLAKHNPIDIFCVDSWEGGVEHQGIDFKAVEQRFAKNVKKAVDAAPNRASVGQIRASSLTGLSQLAASGIRNFDLTYVDGSHMASDVFLDAAMAFQLTRVGGLIIFDDYSAPHEEPQKFDFPRIAIDAFVMVHENKVKEVNLVLEDKDGNPIPKDRYAWYQKYLVKIAE